MSVTVAQELSEVLQIEGLELDSAGCAQGLLPSSLQLYLKYFDDNSGLLVALPLGPLAPDLPAIRAGMLLTANQSLYVTGGGALGLSPDGREVYLSRFFPLNPSVDNRRNQFGAVAGFCNIAAELTTPYLMAVNQLERNEETGAVELPGFDPESFTMPEAVEEEITGDEQQEIDESSRFLGAALRQAGFTFDGFGEDLAWYTATKEERVLVQVRHDRRLGEIVMTSLVTECEPEVFESHATELLSHNYLVQGTDRCVLGISAAPPHGVSLSLAVPLTMLQPDPICLSNLFTGFLENTLCWDERMSGLNQERHEEPMPESCIPV